MTTVFIAGSISISNLHPLVQERIKKVASSDLNVVVGDADGADRSIQQCLEQSGASNVTVYCTGERPRNNVADWPVHHVRSKAREGSRAFYTAKDLEMARSSDYGLMIWDSKSTGTLSNVLELLREQKKSVIFVNKEKKFVTVSDVPGLESLLSYMSGHARGKAEEKISLSQKIGELSQTQLALTQLEESAPSPAHEIQESETADRKASEPQSSRSAAMRLQLIASLRDYIARTHLTQSEAAKAFGVTQPRISDLTRGKADLFGLDALVNMASTAGMSLELMVHENGHALGL